MQLTPRHYEMAAAAYDGYCRQTDYKSLISGAALPAFDKLTDPIKDAWAAAAIAVMTQLELEERGKL
jgi:hypothetical protein